MKLLLVDDHQMVRLGLKSYFELQDDVEVVGEATNGAEGISMALALRPDVIVMDIVMPEVNGIDATLAILKEWPEAKILIVSSYLDNEKIMPVLNAGAKGYMLKTSSADELFHAVQKVAAGELAAYLAGVAAAKTTKTKQIGFVGGMESEVISRFEAGFKAGVESVDSSIKVQVDYAGSFGDAAKGKTIAAAQYAAGADVVYQVAGGTGAGVFSEAKSLNESKNEGEKVWVIGVDRDQVEEGKYTSKDGKEANFVLASTLKQVGTTVQDIANKTEKGEFPGGQVIVYSLKDKGVDLAVTNLSEEGKKAVEDAKAKILDGSIKVPEK